MAKSDEFQATFETDNNHQLEQNQHKQIHRDRHVAVIVLGDVGRSPRMQYHARSLLENNCQVTLIGYVGEDLVPDLIVEQKKENPKFQVIRFSTTSKTLPGFLSKIPVFGKLFYYIMRLIALVSGLYHALWVQMESVPDCILVQNPPSIPLLFLSYIYCKTHHKVLKENATDLDSQVYKRPGLVIDWHNLGYTMFGITSPYHPILIFAKFYERMFGPKADAHLCVTKAMKDFLLQEQFILPKATNNNNQVNVLHDRPPEFFHPCSPKEIHQVFSRYQNDFLDCFSHVCNDNIDDTLNYGDGMRLVEKTLFTVKLKKHDSFFTRANRGGHESEEFEYRMRKDRPALLVSSTSWTPDEDFSILLNALLLFEKKIHSKYSNQTFDSHNESEKQPKNQKGLPKFVVAITGKGPLKEHFQNQIQNINPTLTYISIKVLWLSSSDYPLFIGSADLGISLHTSTSGIDLPMKVLDMMGCQVPVCAISFACVSELVLDNLNGKVFHNEEELSAILMDVFIKDDWKEKNGILGKWRHGIGNMKRWKENWNNEARSVIFGVCDIVENQQKSRLWLLSATSFILPMVLAFGWYMR